MYNKRGLSDIVATLIIILLVIVAAGIIWVVVRNIVGSGADTIEMSQKCVEIELRYSSLVPDTTYTNDTNSTPNITTWTLTFQRRPGGETVLSGVDAVLYDESGRTIMGNVEDIEELDSKTIVIVSNVTVDQIYSVNKIELFPYFINPNTGAKYTCDTPLVHNLQTPINYS